MFQNNYLIIAAASIALGIFFSIIKAVLAWIIMMLIGANLLGLVLRGFFELPPSIDTPTDHLRELYIRESRRADAANIVMTLLSLVLMAAYFFGLFYFWNIGLAVTSGLLMLSRLPDLLWDLRNGRRMTLATMPKGIGYRLASLINWICLPLTWLFLFKWTL